MGLVADRHRRIDVAGLKGVGPKRVDALHELGIDGEAGIDAGEFRDIDARLTATAVVGASTAGAGTGGAGTAGNGVSGNGGRAGAGGVTLSGDMVRTASKGSANCVAPSPATMRAKLSAAPPNLAHTFSLTNWAVGLFIPVAWSQ